MTRGCGFRTAAIGCDLVAGLRAAAIGPGFRKRRGLEGGFCCWGALMFLEQKSGC